MKKTYLQFFLIIVLIFIFMCPLYCFCQQQEKLNYGQLWLELDSTSKEIFFLGVRAGMLYCLRGIFADDSSGLTDLSNIKKEMFLDYTIKRYNDFHENMSVLTDIVTSLYKDPANSYIRFEYMIDIAMKKLKGEDIEPLLQEARKGALQNQ